MHPEFIVLICFITGIRAEQCPLWLLHKAKESFVFTGLRLHEFRVRFANRLYVGFCTLCEARILTSLADSIRFLPGYLSGRGSDPFSCLASHKTDLFETPKIAGEILGCWL